MQFKSPESTSNDQEAAPGPPKPAGKVNVTAGVESQDFPVAGKTVEWVFNRLKDTWNIDPEATALVNGEEVSRSYALKESDQLEFIKLAGQKGV